MKDIPSDRLKQFSDMLKKRSVPAAAHSYYLKWLRYYLDYCAKYNLTDTSSKSLSQFLQKLREKNQTDAQQKQAGHAISLFLDMRATSRLQYVNGCPASGQTYPLNPFPPPEGKIFKVSQQTSTDETKPPPASNVSASSQNQAFNAVLFFFRHVLKKDFGEIRDVVRAKRRPYIPVVLSRDEVKAVIKHLYPPYDLIVKTLYGCGLRLFECIKLRVHNFNFDAGVLTIHDGKGQKDRTVPLPHSIMSELLAQIELLKKLHDLDLAAGYAGLFLDHLLEKKYKNAAREFIWQWFFPQRTLTFIEGANEKRRYHVHESHVRRRKARWISKAESNASLKFSLG